MKENIVQNMVEVMLFAYLLISLGTTMSQDWMVYVGALPAAYTLVRVVVMFSRKKEWPASRSRNIFWGCVYCLIFSVVALVEVGYTLFG